MIGNKSWASLLLPRVLHLLLFLDARAQRPYPLTGADGPLPTNDANGAIAHTDINSSVLLERVVRLLEHENAYEAVWWLVLTWTDFGAGSAVEAATNATLKSGGCIRYCDSSGLASVGCCDGIWLPHIELLNILLYSEEQLPRYRIQANPQTGTVTWSTRLVGTWYTPLDFRAYPFEHQHLLFEFALADSLSPVAGLKWERVVQLNNTAHTKGAELAGWRIQWAKGKVYDSRTCYTAYNITAPWYKIGHSDASGGDSGLQLEGYQGITPGDRYFADNKEKGTTTPPSCMSPHHQYDEARALFGPVVLVADVMIKRVSSYYVLTNLLPVLLITVVSFVVFFMPHNALGDRMGVVLMMFLSLTAMQFVFDFPPANYINALQMVVLVGYIMIALACIESLIVNRIATVAVAVGTKRTCARKYGTALSRGRFHTLGSKFRGSGATAAVGHRCERATQPAARQGSLKGRDGKALPMGWPTAAGSGPAKMGNGEAATCLRNGSGVIELQQLQEGLPTSMSLRTKPTPPTTPTPAEAGLIHGLSPSAAAPSHLRLSSGRRHGPTAAAATAALASLVSASKCCTGGNIAVLGADDSIPNLPLAVTLPTGALPPPNTVSSFSVPPTTYISLAAAAHDGASLPPITAVSTTDAQSVGSSSHASAFACTRASCAALLRRCREQGLRRSVGILAAALWSWLGGAVTAPQHLYRQCKEDAVFASFLAMQIDKWSCIASVVIYVVTVTVLLIIEVRVGDHKLMLGDRPGNM